MSVVKCKKSARLSRGLGALDETRWNADLDALVKTLEARHPDP